MPTKMTETCEKCGESVVHEKDEDGLEAVEVEPFKIMNMCSDCADEHREQEASYSDDVEDIEGGDASFDINSTEKTLNRKSAKIYLGILSFNSA